MPQVTTNSAATVNRRRTVGRILRLLPHLADRISIPNWRLPNSHRFLIVSSGRAGRRRAPTPEELSNDEDDRVQGLDERQARPPGGGGPARQQRGGLLRQQRLRGHQGVLERGRRRAVLLPAGRALTPVRG